METLKMNVFVCGHSWGIGGCRVWNKEIHDWEWMYGLYRPENPHDFSPDYENCSRDEIENWLRDMEAWDRPRHELGQCIATECVICRGEGGERKRKKRGKSNPQDDQVQK